MFVSFGTNAMFNSEQMLWRKLNFTTSQIVALRNLQLLYRFIYVFIDYVKTII